MKNLIEINLPDPNPLLSEVSKLIDNNTDNLLPLKDLFNVLIAYSTIRETVLEIKRLNLEIGEARKTIENLMRDFEHSKYVLKGYK